MKSRIERIYKDSQLTTKDYFFMRIEENSNSTLHEIKYDWTLEEVVDFHIKLDTQAKIQQEYRKDQERKVKKAR